MADRTRASQLRLNHIVNSICHSLLTNNKFLTNILPGHLVRKRYIPKISVNIRKIIGKPAGRKTLENLGSVPEQFRSENPTRHQPYT